MTRINFAMALITAENGCSTMYYTPTWHDPAVNKLT